MVDGPDTVSTRKLHILLFAPGCTDAAYEVNRSQIVLAEELGKGEYGEVYCGMLNRTTYAADIALSRLCSSRKLYIRCSRYAFT